MGLLHYYCPIPPVTPTHTPQDSHPTSVSVPPPELHNFNSLSVRTLMKEFREGEQMLCWQ